MYKMKREAQSSDICCFKDSGDYCSKQATAFSVMCNNTSVAQAVA